jgi:molybdenum cofactor biosynthesis enzyme MoaA
MREEHEERANTESDFSQQELITIIEVLAALGVKKIRFTSSLSD